MILKKLLESIFQFFQHKVRKTKFFQMSLTTKELIKHENKFNRKVFHGTKNSENRFSKFSYFTKGFKKGSRTIAPEENCPPDNCLLDDCPPDNCPRTISPEDNCPRGNCPRTITPLNIKVSPKIVAPSQAISPQTVLEYYEWTEENYELLTSTIIAPKLFLKAAN